MYQCFFFHSKNSMFTEFHEYFYSTVDFGHEICIILIIIFSRNYTQHRPLTILSDRSPSSTRTCLMMGTTEWTLNVFISIYYKLKQCVDNSRGCLLIGIYLFGLPLVSLYRSRRPTRVNWQHGLRSRFIDRCISRFITWV